MRTNLSRTDFVLVTHLQATWNRALRENVDPHLAVEREGRSLPVVLQFDPTAGRYHAWLANWRRHLWDARGFRVPLDLHDLDEARRALAWFEDVRDRLPVERRDIGQYKTSEDLRRAVPTRLAEGARRAERETLKREARVQSEELFRHGRWMVVRLSGFAAARFWGLGTKWCTTSSEQVYRQYASGGELLVFLTPRGKYQLATRGPTFRDERDRSVDPRAFQGAPDEFLALLRFHRGK